MRSDITGVPNHTEWTPERVALAGRFLGLAIIGGILLGLFAAAMQIYWIVAAIGLLLLAVVVSWQFEAALAIYVLVAFVPFGQSPGLTGGSGVSKGLYVSEAMLCFLLLVWFGKYVCGLLPKNRLPREFTVPLTLYMCYCLLNVVISFLFWDYHVNRIYQHPMVNAVELGLHLLSICSFLMFATSIKDKKWLKYITYAVFAAGIYNALNNLLGNIIPIAAMWGSLLFLLPAGYALAVLLDNRRSLVARSIAGLSIAVAIELVFVKSITWVSGWLALFACIGTVLYVRSKKVFAVSILIAALCFCAAKPFIQSNVVETSKSEGDYDRFALMAGAWRYATTFPLGVGLGNYRSYNSFHYGQEWGTTSYTSAHGTYSQHLSEMGIPGLFLLLMFLGVAFRWMVVNYRKLPNGFSKNILLASTGQMAAIVCAAIIGDYIIPTYHNGGVVTFSTTVYSWIIWGLTVAHVRICNGEADGSLDSYS